PVSFSYTSFTWRFKLKKLEIRTIYLFLFFVVGTTHFVIGQIKPGATERRGDRYLSEAHHIQSGESYTIRPGFVFTSAFVRCSSCTSFAGASIVAGADTFLLKPDIHAPIEVGLQSHLIIFPDDRESFLLLANDLQGEITIVYLNALGKKREPTNERLDKPDVETTDACEAPKTIGQEVSRSGLGAPSYTRSFTKVAHLIVHHSATSNHLQDYTNVVRNIYLLHTEGNGWSDVGYNYLIAPDGTIFEGRDPGNGDQDNVLGAHLCGSNTGTMGICLLGEYGSAKPTAAMMDALQQLLAWKASKDELDPLAAFYHPANSQLGTIAGHKDGCSTECPGDNVYNLLLKTRQEVAALIQNCQPADEVVLYPNPTADIFNVPTSDFASFRWECYDILGREAKLDFVTIANGEVSFSVRHLTAGVYVVRFEDAGQVFERKLIVL